MTGTCSLRLVCRFCSWPTPRSQCQTSMTVDRPVASASAQLRLGYASGKSFSFAVFEWTHEKIYYIKKETIPHMANTNVCRYSQCIAPKTPTTQTAVKLPMSSAVFFENRKSPPRQISIKALRKRQWRRYANE